MAEIVTPVDEKRFNPARYVYMNNKNEKCMDLPARLMWFYSDRKGWRITLDGVRAVGIETYVDQEYVTPEHPNEPEVVREKEIENYAIGFFSIINEEGYRVTTTGASVKMSNGDFMEELMEKGYFLLLDFCGYSPYNISVEDWVRLAREKGAEAIQQRKELDEIQARFRSEVNESKTPVSFEKPKEPKKPRKQSVAEEMFTSPVQKEPEEKPLIPREDDRPEGQTPAGISESVIRMEDCSKEQLLQIFKMTLSAEDLAELEDNPKELNDRFDMLCLKEAGEPWVSIKDNPASRKLLIEALENRLRQQKQRLNGRR